MKAAVKQHHAGSKSLNSGHIQALQLVCALQNAVSFQLGVSEHVHRLLLAAHGGGMLCTHFPKPRFLFMLKDAPDRAQLASSDNPATSQS